MKKQGVLWISARTEVAGPDDFCHYLPCDSVGVPGGFPKMFAAWGSWERMGVPLVAVKHSSYTRCDIQRMHETWLCVLGKSYARRDAC